VALRWNGVAPELLSLVARRTHATSKYDDAQPQPNQTLVRMRWEIRTDSKYDWWPTRLAKGTLVADIKGPKGNEIVRANLDEKPWLERSPGRDFLVVTSGPPATSKEDALRELRLRAVEAVSTVIFTRTNSQPGMAASPDDVRTQARLRLVGEGAAFTDMAVVAVDRPYGRVWSASALVRVAPDEVGQMAHAARGLTVERRKSFAAAAGGSAGMLLVLLAVYAGVNAVTRGYFRMQLRVAVVLVIGVAAAAVFFMMA
jgi:hypothetical protein